MILLQEIVSVQDGLTRAWHDQPAADFNTPEGALDGVPNEDKLRQDWLRLVARQHHANFDLWHIEDEARRPGSTDTELAGIKRRIDLTNQLRNALVEDLDRRLLGLPEKRALPNEKAPLPSETP